MDEPWTKDSQTESVPYGGPGAPPPKAASIPRLETPLKAAAPSSPAKTGRPTRATEETPLPPSALEKPGLDLPRLLRAETEIPKFSPPPASARIVISRAGRKDVVLQFFEGSLRGDVRGMPLNLSITADTVSGRLGDDELLIRILGTHRAQGSVGGRDLAFTFNPTETGCIVGASLPEHGGRVELDTKKLSFLPGCSRDLKRDDQTSGSYAGICADGTKLRVDLPPSFLALPELVRMVILGLLLPEPEMEERNGRRGLFPEP